MDIQLTFHTIHRFFSKFQGSEISFRKVDGLLPVEAF